MTVNWVRIYNRLFEIINSEGEAYFSGGRFISKVREIDPYFYGYSQYIEERRRQGKSTSRRDYFYDILIGFNEDDRLAILTSILEEVRHLQPERVAALEREGGLTSSEPRGGVNTDRPAAGTMTPNQIHVFQTNAMTEHTTPVSSTQDSRSHDAFISHASEDKDFVKPLAEALVSMGIDVWYDTFVLKVGDSLRKSIDQGLLSSRFGIVVLSKAFFEKRWPNYELNGLVAREKNGRKVILPVWRELTHDDVLKYSPPLADKVALTYPGRTIEQIADELAQVIRSQ